MSGTYVRFRKRPYQAPRDADAFSGVLRGIGRDASQRRTQAALAKANRLLEDPGLEAGKRAAVLALVADCEFARGRFEAAARIHLQVSATCMEQPRAWLRPMLGHVRALLKVPDVDLAATMARHVVDVAVRKMEGFDESVRTARRDVLDRGEASVPPLPPRVSVVASRLAQLFLQEGEPEIAGEFYLRAVRSGPGGGNRAKQALARLALARGDFRKALELSHEAIRQGNYRVKTLPAWAVLIAARRHLGGWKISEKLLAGLDAAPGEVRARAILVVVSELRRNGMRQWREVAERWSRREGERFPIVEAEIRKLRLASAKTDAEPGVDRLAAAEILLRTPGLSPQEWLMAAKETVRSAFGRGGGPDLAALVRSAGEGYGPGFVPKARHGLALACLEARRREESRALLEANVQDRGAKAGIWARSTWALAGMEKEAGRPAGAAELYRRLSENESVEPRFRLQARLRWAEALLAAGRPEALAEALPLMDAVLAQVADAGVLMDFARQLRTGPPEFAARADRLFARAEELAAGEFGKIRCPDLAVSVLFKLARRQVLDFGRGAKTLETWEAFDAAQRDWLWSESSAFWEYMGLVFEAYARTGRAREAARFARELLADPATPAHGAPWVGVPFARRLAEGGEPDEALAVFARLAKAAPRHGLCAWAWYWLALEARRRGDRKAELECAANVREAQGVRAGTWNEWQLDVRALLLLADLDPARLDARAARYEASLFREQRQRIAEDAERLVR